MTLSGAASLAYHRAGAEARFCRYRNVGGGVPSVPVGTAL